MESFGSEPWLERYSTENVSSYRCYLWEFLPLIFGSIWQFHVLLWCEPFLTRLSSEKKAYPRSPIKKNKITEYLISFSSSSSSIISLLFFSPTLSPYPSFSHSFILSIPLILLIRPSCMYPVDSEGRSAPLTLLFMISKQWQGHCENFWYVVMPIENGHFDHIVQYIIVAAETQYMK